MKTLRIIATAVLLLSTGIVPATGRSNSVMASSEVTFAAAAPELSVLTLQNGIAAGKALLALFNQYKSTGKLDLSNTTNLTNIVSLVTNVKGLTGKSTVSTTPADFISGLISGSSNLVTQNNTGSVLSALGSLASLDTGAITKSATTAVANAAASKATSALGKLLGSKSSSTTASSASDTAASTAASVLTSLFSSLK